MRYRNQQPESQHEDANKLWCNQTNYPAVFAAIRLWIPLRQSGTIFDWKTGARFFLTLFLASSTFTSISILILPSQAIAVERGVSGPIGFSDVQAALLPPPGLYSAASLVSVTNERFFNTRGDRVSFLDDLDSTSEIVGATFLYVPDVKVFDGSVGLLTVLAGGQICGRTFASTDERCLRGFRDPYVELSWSKSFGKLRFSEYEGAPPIIEGLSLRLGMGVIVPIGKYDLELAQSHGLTLGRNIWDFVPHAAITYTTPPIIGEATEFSFKFHYNKYLSNSDTDYSTGDLWGVDFAVTEKIGRFQVGLAGEYYDQIEGDEQFGQPVRPDGRPAKSLSLGFVGIATIPEIKSAIKIKATSSVINDNLPESMGVSISLIKKLF